MSAGTRVRRSSIADSPGAAGPVLKHTGMITRPPALDELAALAGDPEPDPDPLAWQAQALCAEVDADIFFPDKGGSTREAKKVCRACEVRAECLEYALANGERFGIWGGVTERARRRLEPQQAI